MPRILGFVLVAIALFIATAVAGLFPNEKFPTGDGPSAIAVGDFNQDGLTDVVTAN